MAPRWWLAVQLAICRWYLTLIFAGSISLLQSSGHCSPLTNDLIALTGAVPSLNLTVELSNPPNFELTVARGLDFIHNHGLPNTYRLTSITVSPPDPSKDTAAQASDFSSYLIVYQNPTTPSQVFYSSNTQSSPEGWTGPSRILYPAFTKPPIQDWDLREVRVTLTQALNRIRNAGYVKPWHLVSLTYPRTNQFGGDGPSIEPVYAFYSNMPQICTVIVGARSGSLASKSNPRPVETELVASGNISEAF